MAPIHYLVSRNEGSPRITDSAKGGGIDTGTILREEPSDSLFRVSQESTNCVEKLEQARRHTEYVTRNLVANPNPTMLSNCTASNDLSFCSGSSTAREVEDSGLSITMVYKYTSASKKFGPE